MREAVVFALVLSLVGCVHRAGTLATGPAVAAQAASDPAEPKYPRESPTISSDTLPPIPIQVALDEPGYVTLVIEDATGRRVRNLISETRLPAGRNVVYWDGLDDLDRDANAAAHAVYHIPGKLVPPGEYRVRGLFRKEIDLFYEFTVYNPGNPPWPTRDRSSEWLTNHTPPSAVCFVPAGSAPARATVKVSEGIADDSLGHFRLSDRAGEDTAGQASRGTPSPPQVLIGSFVAEGGSGLAWVSLKGIKLHGQMWVGGVWTGAAYLTRDVGDQPVPGVYAYTGTAWEGDGYNKNQPELRLHSLVNASRKIEAPRDTRFGVGEDPPVLKPTYKFPDKKLAALGGMAAWNGLVVVSLPKMNQLLFVDAAAQKVLGTGPLEDGRGLAFERDGRLLVLSGRRLLRITLPSRATVGLSDRAAPRAGEDTAGQASRGTEAISLPEPQVVVATGLEDPQAIALDDQGNIYVSDRGASHQVKVFAPDGRFLRAIGTPGVPHAGPYDPNHMNNPKGITITSDGHLWVAEEDFQPKRISVWTLDGKLVMAFYGPPIYGGGGVLDPEDRTLFYLGGMTFRLDWQTGTGQPVFIHHRPGPKDLQIPGDWGGGTPETPIYARGRKFWTNVFTTHPTNGASTAYLWQDRGGLAVPVAALGRAGNWPALKTDAIESRLPKGVDPKKADWNSLLFAWSDLNGDAQIQPEEVTFAKGSTGSGVTVSPDLTMVTGHAIAFAPQSFTAQGVPVYDLSKSTTVVPDPQQPTTSGGGQVLVGRDGWTVLTVAPKPFAPQSMGGAQNGKALWSYPSAWPGLHASHIAPMPEFPGELIGTTRLLGPAFSPRHGEAGELWAINGNKGNVYLLTTDGLFVATLFRDCRIPEAAWSSKPKAVRGMRLSDVTNMEESFWPSITETRDGKVYLVTNWPSILRVEGLESIRRLRPTTLTVTPDLLAAAQSHFLRSEARRQEKAKASETLVVAIRQAAPVVDGKLEDWAGAQWVTVDVRAKQQGDWGRSEQKTQAAVAIAGDRLYAAFKTGEPNLLANSGASMQNLFKTGGALDLMIGTDPKADPKRNRALFAENGDVRLLVAAVKGKPAAVLYRPVAPGAVKDPVTFSSPLRTITFDRVEEVSQSIAFAKGEKGEFELSVPLSVLGLKPEPGLVLRGDIGVLRGDGDRTVQRAYWHNKATGLTSDIPTEAELTPQLWGRWDFRAAP